MAGLRRKLEAVARKPLRVTLFRARQEAALLALQATGGFARMQGKALRSWSEQRAADLLAARCTHPTLLDPTTLAAAPALARSEPELAAAVRAAADTVRSGRYRLLGQALRLDALDWHADPRFGHRWPRQFFTRYDHYAPRRTPYDVKMPWELNRLLFLVPLMQEALVFPDAPGLEESARILADWESENPLAHSLAWYPMEASMRAVTLVVLLDLAAAMARRQPAAARALGARLARLLALHGRFIWHTREYSDVRGNHYAANVVALLLAGAALRTHDAAAARWLGFALAEQTREILGQFLADGGNIEKSLPYHKLVAELFLLGLIAAERQGVTDVPARQRLFDAIAFLAAMRRADGLLPVIGDCDDARALGFDALSPRCSDPVIVLAAAVSGRPVSFAPPPAARLAAHWITGRQPEIDPRTAPTGLHVFAPSGFVVARAGSSMLIVDAGEVGLHGRGGHGHNDITSFELVLGGLPLIVDAGCPVYTGDPAKRNAYRGTAAHNVLMIRDREFAPLSGLWGIADTARPRDVATEEGPHGTRIRVGHGGYDDLVPLFRATREFLLARDGGSLEIVDSVESAAARPIERLFHCDAGVEVAAADDTAILTREGRRFRLRALDGTRVEVRPGMVSPGYGVEQPAAVLVLRNEAQGRIALSVRIEMLDQG